MLDWGTQDPADPHQNYGEEPLHRPSSRQILVPFTSDHLAWPTVMDGGMPETGAAEGGVAAGDGRVEVENGGRGWRGLHRVQSRRSS